MYAFDAYRLDPVRRQLLGADGNPVPLMPKALDTLVYLVERAGQTVRKEELLRAVWPNVVVEENNLTQNISALRKALGERTGEHRFIVTIPGQGYRFVARVERLSIDAEENRTHSFEQPAAIRPGPTRRRAIGIVLIAAVAMATGTAVLLGSSNTPGRTMPRAIAVLPFKPIVATEPQEAIQLGMADSLIMELSRSPHLIVRPLSATRRFTATDQDPLAAGRQLRVEAVLDGTIQMADGRIRASARLLRVSDGRQLWAGKFDEEFSGIFEVQDTIARRVAQTLAVRLDARAQPATLNTRAYELYMKGRVHAMRLVMPEVRRGIEYYEQALREDPSYALPYAGIAEAMRPLVLSNDVPATEILPRAREAAEHALGLAPNLAEANHARGMIAFMFDRDWATAEHYLARAVELAPNNGEGHIYLAHLYSNLGRSDEALAHAERAGALNPVSPLIGALQGQFLGHSGQLENAIRKLREVTTLEPGFWLGHHLLANALIDAGQYEEALAASTEAKRLSPLQTYSDCLIALAHAGLGRENEARTILNALTNSSEERFVPPTHLALIHVALGEKDAAIQQLEAAIEARDARLAFLKIDPKWKPLRADPRFADLLRRVGFES